MVFVFVIVVVATILLSLMVVARNRALRCLTELFIALVVGPAIGLRPF